MADRRYALLKHQFHEGLVLPYDGTIELGTPTAGHAAGWRDLVGQLREQRAVGAGVPVWTQVGTTGYYFYLFDVNDTIQVTFHIDHDYAVGTPIYIHAHWFSYGGTDTNTVKWEFSSVYADGHGVGVFDFANPVIDSVEQAPNGALYHMIAEIADPGLTEFDFTVDGLLTVIAKRVTNGATDNADQIFLKTVDCHYKADRFATKNKAPNFYT